MRVPDGAVRVGSLVLGFVALSYFALRFVGWDRRPEGPPGGEAPSITNRAGDGRANFGTGRLPSEESGVVPTPRQNQDLATSLPPVQGEKMEGSAGGDVGFRSRDLLIRFSGNLSFSDSEILAGVRLPERFHLKTIEQDIVNQVRLFYESRGFPSAIVKIASSVEGHPSIVEVTVVEGAVFTVGAMEIQGLSYFSKAEILPLYPRVGQVASRGAVDEANRYLRTQLEDAGFLDARVTLDSSPGQAPNSLRYIVNVEEGPLYRVGECEVPVGYRSTFPFRKGELYSSPRLETFLNSMHIEQRQVVVDRYPETGTVEITIIE